jgi:UDP-N-acetylmuramoyl-L-alanyl-D-glutamate--2,6-diaminopimelate ligase
MEIRGILFDSRRVKAGDLFFALPGTRTDGNRFVREALQRGARAVVVWQKEEVPPGVTTIQARHPRRLLATLANRFYRQPTNQLALVGVTGTSGKTTVTYLLESIWQAAGWQAGVIGTINYRYNGHPFDRAQDRLFPAALTTPEAVELQELLLTMVKAGVSHVAMEVSSHALAQERVRGCQWNGAIFTNLGRDHLDFHRDMEEYFSAKSRLFLDFLLASGKADRFAVINADDPWGKRLWQQLAAACQTSQTAARVLTYGHGRNLTASVTEVEESQQGLRGVLLLEGTRLPFTSPLVGDLQLFNLMAAGATAWAQEVPGEAIVEGIRKCTNVPGRLEPINTGQDFAVFVDYAHKPDALERVLQFLRRLTSGRLITVFGCGGDRDKGKRPLMGKVAARLSNVVILTSDNSRTEDPLRILQDIEQGITEVGMAKILNENAVKKTGGGYLVIENRRQAITTAILAARPGEVVLIAGKGHEDYQIIGRQRHHFDDREEARRVLKEAVSG